MTEVNTYVSSGNVFSDLDLPDADDLLLRADLFLRIGEKVHERGMASAEAAHLLGLSESEYSDLVRGRLGSFPIDRLQAFLNILQNTN